jgi:peptide-methionine (S)-S-oxide reductase
MSPQSTSTNEREIATLAGGCFWCLEAVFNETKGVQSVESGYMGGKVADPSYEDVCTGRTGHAEVVQIGFDPKAVSFHELLEVFFVIHDPTTLNRQGNDVGTQYRSAIFYHSAQQKTVAHEVIARLSAEKVYDEPIITEVVPASAFYRAEDYHQEYFQRNPNQPYCAFVVKPKVAKFRKQFLERVKK